MKPTPAEQLMWNALEDVLDRATEHPCFDRDCFDRRDVDGLCDQGGDICDWTMIAIIADDALKAASQSRLSDTNAGNQ